MDSIGDIITIPDAWQSGALALLERGSDVIVDAPTGAGKTYIFEMLIERGFSGRAVYTVPTRALANDKYAQWKARGWRVGISTGDRSVDAGAPIVVATLETQKNSIFEGCAPRLLVIDEYQLVADTARGFNYELAIALAPASTQLLLLSGSVENTADVCAWLRRLGRDCAVVSHGARAVPLEEIVSTALPDGDLRGISGMWPRLVKRIIDAGMAPALIFAPRRAEAEAIARSLATQLPCPDFLSLPRSDASAAGRELANMLRRRVAFHHSGLSVRQRAEIVEKYAREGRLNAVVATTGLGAGVNFSMRTAIVASREYETAEGAKILRADELLQMYGRAGRRGLDKVGFAVCLPGKPRLADAKKCALRRVNAVDSAASMRILARAADEGRDCLKELENFYARLFTEEKIDIGISAAARARAASAPKGEKKVFKREILNSKNSWERRRNKTVAELSEVLFFDGEWKPFLECRKAVESLGLGRAQQRGGEFGILLDVAFTRGEEFVFTKRAKKIIAAACAVDRAMSRFFAKNKPTLKNIKRNFPKLAELIFAGAKCAEIGGENGVVRARMSLEKARVYAVADSLGAKLYEPPERSVDASGEGDFETLFGGGAPAGSLAAQWRRFGLVDSRFAPTLRGRIVSFFSGGEGFAVAAALEDDSYAVGDLVFDLANLRAGGRFHLSQSRAGASPRLADCCRMKFFAENSPGALKAGVPIAYGDGASEIVREVYAGARAARFEEDLVLRGDIERVYLEWLSILRHIASLPSLDFPRWQQLKTACAAAAG